MTDSFSLSFLSERIKKSYKVYFFKNIDSTNSELLRKGNSLLPLLNEEGLLTENGKLFDKTLVVAEKQTKGRGRLGRSFFSPSKTGLYMSFSLVHEGGIKDPFYLTVSCAVGVCRAIEHLTGSKCEVKWVNDIYLSGKKVCGILAEGIVNPSSGLVEASVLGIGINIVLSSSFPSELKEKVGALQDGSNTKKRISRLSLLSAVVEEIDSILSSGESVIDEYRSLSLLTGKEIFVHPISDGKEEFQAKVLGITDDAGLLVELLNGETKILRSGEVTLHSPE